MSDEKPLGLAKGLFFWGFRLMNLNRLSIHRLALLLLGVLVLLSYWPGLSGGFFFDDGPSILQAPGLHISELTWDALTQAWLSGGAGPTGRPVAQMSFGLNHYVSGLDPRPYKLTNLVIHVLCGWLVYGVVCQLLPGRTAKAPQGDPSWVALAVTALWMLHPLQLLPVLHVVQRMTSLSALFLLTAFWLHLLARSGPAPIKPGLLLLAWGIAWPLSILSKETGLLLPLFVLAWELLLRRAQVGRLDGFARLYAACCLVLGVAVLAYLLSPLSDWLWAGYGMRPFDATQRLLTEARVMWLYVALALGPLNSVLALHHDGVAISTGVLSPWPTAVALLGWLAVLWLILSLRRKVPLLAFGLSWFLIGHLLESTVLPLELVHEHRNYLPLLGLLLAVAAAYERWGSDRLKPATLAFVTILATVLCAALTAARAHDFGDPLRRALAEVQHHPHSPRSQYEAGLAIASVPAAAKPGSLAYQTARHHLERAAALDAHHKLALLELLALDCKAGRGVDQPVLQELALRLGQTRFAPGDRNILYQAKEAAIAGELCLDRSQLTTLFTAALANPQMSPFVQAMLYSWLADYLWLGARDLAAAKLALSRSLALNPAQTSNRLKWAQLLWIGGDRQAAQQLLLKLRAERLTPDERQTLEQLLAAGNITPP